MSRGFKHPGHLTFVLRNAIYPPLAAQKCHEELHCHNECFSGEHDCFSEGLAEGMESCKAARALR